MKIGDEYLLPGIPGQVNRDKVIMFDDNEVFHDQLLDDNSLKYTKGKTVIYSRTTRAYYDENSIYLRSSGFTEMEMQIHRPDLPLTLNSFKNIFWSSEKIEDVNHFISFLETKGITEDQLTGLNSDKVVVFPKSQQQSLKQSILLESNKGMFSGTELLFRCFQIQQAYVKVNKPYFSRFRLISGGREEHTMGGIGIHRLGIKGNVPSYYLGGHISSLAFECIVFK